MLVGSCWKEGHRALLLPDPSLSCLILNARVQYPKLLLQKPPGYPPRVNPHPKQEGGWESRLVWFNPTAARGEEGEQGIQTLQKSQKQAWLARLQRTLCPYTLPSMVRLTVGLSWPLRDISIAVTPDCWKGMRSAAPAGLFPRVTVGISWLQHRSLPLRQSDLKRFEFDIK